MKKFNSTNQLLESNPFEFSESNKKLFVDSFREMSLHHYENSKGFKVFWQSIGMHPNEVQTEADLFRVPPILVTLFKEKRFLSVSPESVVLTLTSSGTGGQKSEQHLDQYSLDNVKKLAYRIHQELGMTSDDSVNYLCFTYDPRVASDLGTAFTDELLTSFTKINEVYYAIQWNESKKDFELNTEGVIATLKRFSQMKNPVRVLGFPAFLYKILKDHDLHFNFGPQSWVQTGGGWKNFSNEEIPKHEFRRFVSERLGLPETNVRDLFGMVEHGIPYVDCELGNLHIPNYARVFIRSPRDLSALPMGEVGLIHFLCSYNSSYPCISLLTTDYGKIETCSCQHGGQSLKILGRAGVTKHKGCAIKALETVIKK